MSRGVARLGQPPALAGARGDIRMPKKKRQPAQKPGACIPWEEKVKELPPITGDKELARKVWEDVDSLAYIYIWQCLVSF